MTISFQTKAAVRYGFGLSSRFSPPGSAEEMLDSLKAEDAIAIKYPQRTFDSQAEQERVLSELRRDQRNGKDGAEAAYRRANRKALTELAHEFRVTVLRAMVNPDGFRERLVAFWADHFAVSARGKGLRLVTTAYVEEAIRANMTGKFGDLLIAAVTHPVMLVYLDQVLSIGPNSPLGKRSGRGLNENLAREILELHTLGVGGYAQVDVRELAELLTGLTYNFRGGLQYRVRAAEPGSERILGKTYARRRDSLREIHAALNDIARHPDTARHIARKLVVHFVSDEPDPELVDHVAAAFRASDGDLMETYAALLQHPAAWDGIGRKAKRPFEFIVSALRALDAKPRDILDLNPRDTRLYLAAPMEVMGQPWQNPPGPNGWPENLEDWITPQGLAARIQWSLTAAALLGGQTDPREFARSALGDLASDQVLRAAGFAESRREGIALVLASPEFNRR